MDFNCENPCVECPPPSIDGLGLSPTNPSNPFSNLSSEAPDIDLFIGRRYFRGGFPPLGRTWYAAGCLGFCSSTFSQEDADLCASRQATLCVSPLWPQPNPGTGVPEPRPTRTNDEQSCTLQCPDGTLNKFTVRPNTFLAFDAGTANAMARAYACEQVSRNFICILGTETDFAACSGSLIELLVIANSRLLPVQFEVVSGSIPEGLLLQQSTNSLQLLISGIVTTGGTYNFTIRATNTFQGGPGNSADRNYTIVIAEIANNSELPNAVIGEPYEQGLVFLAPDGPSITWAVLGGLEQLPSWLNLNDQNGFLFGTPPPEAEGPYTFAISASNGTLTCVKEFTLNVDEAPSVCVDWSLIPWDGHSQFADPGATASFTPINTPGDSFSCSATNTGPFQFATAENVTNEFIYNGEACQSKLNMEWAGNGSFFVQVSSITNLGDPIGLLNKNQFATAPGVHEFLFFVPSTAGENYTIRVSVFVSANFNIPGANAFSGTFSNV